MVYWEKLGNGNYKIIAKLENISGWYSATRLPASWRNKIKQEIGIEIESIFRNSDRNNTIKKTLPSRIVSVLDYLMSNKLYFHLLSRFKQI